MTVGAVDSNFRDGWSHGAGELLSKKIDLIFRFSSLYFVRQNKNKFF